MLAARHALQCYQRSISLRQLVTVAAKWQSPVQRALPVASAIMVQQKSLAASSAAVQKRPGHSKFFLIERIWAVGLIPLFPAAFFIQGPTMDFLLATAIALHAHWGIEIVVEDYARPLIVGEKLPGIAVKLVYVLSALMYAGLLYFNFSDVGITKAFEMIWSL